MPGFERLWENGPLFAQAEHFRLSTDCVLLADFVNTAGAVRGIDLGCASGAIALLLLTRTDKLHMTGLEIVPEAASLAEENMRANALEARSDIVCGDIRRHRELFKAGSFDLIALARRCARRRARRDAVQHGGDMRGLGLSLPHRRECEFCPQARAAVGAVLLHDGARHRAEAAAPCLPSGGGGAEPRPHRGPPRRQAGA